MITACCNCLKVRNKAGEWLDIDLDRDQEGVSHGICQECADKLYPEYSKRLYDATKGD